MAKWLPDCPVCPHVIADHEAGGCVATKVCACAVPGSELELMALRRGRTLQPHERARDLVLDDADELPDSSPDSSGTPDTPPGSSESGPGRPESSAPGPIPDDNGDLGGPERPEPPGESSEQSSEQSSTPGDPGDNPTPADDDGPVTPVDFRGNPLPPAAVQRPSGKRGRIYDWPTIKRRYVEGVALNDGTGMTEWPSLDNVAAHFGLPAARIREKSSVEGWVGQRQKWQAQMEAVRQQARAGALAKSGIEVDKHAIDASKLGLQLCLAVLGDRARQVQAQRSANAGQDGPQITLSALELSRLAQAVDLWHRIGLRAVGDPEVTRLEVTGAGGRPIEIAAELKRDDPQRLAGVLAVLTSAGLGDLFGGVDPRGAVEAHRGDDGVYTTESPGR